MVIAVDILDSTVFIQAIGAESDDGIKCTNWIEILKKLILKKMHTNNFCICSNSELKDDINCMISKDEFRSRNIPVIYFDRRSAALGYYFKHIKLENIKENENIVLIEIYQATSTGYIYQLHDHLYRLRNIINVVNDGGITEETFHNLIADLVGGNIVKRFIVVYEEGCFRCRDKIDSQFKQKHYEYKFIKWSETDACNGFLKRATSNEKFPLFDHKIRNHIKEESNKKVIHCNKELSVKILNDLSDEFTDSRMRVHRIPMAINHYTSRTSIMGIDLGTSRCSVAVSRNREVEAVKDNNGNRSFKSFISFDQSRPIAGGVAFKRFRDKPQYVVFDVKRIIGKQKCHFIEKNDLWPFQIRDSENGVEIVTKTNSDKNTFSAIELSAILLAEMKRMATEFQKAYNDGQPIEEAVISVPSFFDDDQRKATREAAKLAGIKVLDLLEEPVAGALYYIANKGQTTNSELLENQNILIFDLGGGTLDISIMQLKNEELREIGRTGDPYLGGRDFDDVLDTYISTILESEYKTQLENHSKQKYKLMNMVENAKIDLSITNRTEIQISEVGDDDWNPIEITRKKFEELSGNLLTKINNKVRDVLLQSKIQKIDKVVYIGGGSRMPMIKDNLKKIFPDSEHYCGVDSELATAIGAVIRALQLYQDRN